MHELYGELYEYSKKKAVHTIWLMSDLQQSDPDKMESCLTTSMDDYINYMGSPAEAIWYLGDAVEGSDRQHLIRMTDRQEKAFSALGVPVCYVAGNHDFDYSQKFPDERCEPFLDMIRSHPGWHTIDTTADCYFRVPLGDQYEVFFFSDHMAVDRSWCATHGVLRWGDMKDYPYNAKDFERIHDEMRDCGKKVITCSHCSFPGGARQSAWLSKLMPLPQNVCIHFFGHSHIGDMYWGVRDVYRRISWVDYHDIPQLNISSFENIRGDKCRSAILHIYEDGKMGIFWRTHDDHRFCEAFFPADIHYPEHMLQTQAFVNKIRTDHPDWNIGNEAYRDPWPW